MFDLIENGLGTAVAILPVAIGVVLLMWMDTRFRAEDRKLTHAERLKALEVGQLLPDAEVTRYKAEASRSRVVGWTAILVPLGMGATGAGATELILSKGSSHIQLPILCVVWGVCGLVALVAVSVALEQLRQPREERRRPGLASTPAPTPAKQPEHVPAPSRKDTLDPTHLVLEETRRDRED